MRFIDLNPLGGIGANSYYVEIGNLRIVVDAGLNPKEMGLKAIPDFSKIPALDLDLILITHCHLDHLASLPVLARSFPSTPIWMSQPSRILYERILHNSINVMKKQREEHGIVEYPLYTHSELDRLRDRTYGVPFQQSRVLDNGSDTLEITFYPSGHIPGAAGIELIHKRRRIFFSGDVLFSDLNILTGASFPKHPLDTLILETTRGLTERPPERSRETEVQRLIQTMQRTLAHGGSVLIPAFAMGRMQEMLSILFQAKKARALPEVPIYASGLGMDLVDYFDEISRKYGLTRFRKGILKELGVKPLPPDLKPGFVPLKPCIYVVSSGMMVENTPAYLVASTLFERAENAICFVGYCDPDTPGGKLQTCERGTPFRFDKLHYEGLLRAQIERFDLSSHAEREELLNFTLETSPRALVLTHGDPEARAWFFDQVIDLNPNTQILDPEPGREYIL
jgi:Cft2 family RNA processing exonuclease